MELVRFKGFEVFLQRHWWEVYTIEGRLLANGRGGLEEARHWIMLHLLHSTDANAKQIPAHH